VGTASLQVARGLGARTIAVVSTEEKADFALRAGAHEAVLAEGFLTSVKDLTGGRGVDIVVDVVGEPLLTDALRTLAPLGRLLVVGFTGGEIPQVRLNRLLLNNIDVRGVGWGAYAMTRPGFMLSQWERLVPMMEAGVIDPPLGRVYPLEQVAAALVEMDERRTLGKSVVRFTPSTSRS
jgi:NADPH:quinone reductase